MHTPLACSPSMAYGAGMVRVEIPVVDEGFALEGRLDGPPDGPRALVCHPHPAFGGTLDTPLVAELATSLAAVGQRVLRFNFRGVGASGGQGTGGLAEVRDVHAACTFLRDGHRDRPVALCGYSFGALMGAVAIAEGEPLRRFVAIGFPTVIVSHDDARVAKVRTAFAAQPTLVLSGDRDQFCALPDLRSWLASSRHAELPPALVVLPGVGHFPEGAARADLIARAVAFLDQ